MGAEVDRVIAGRVTARLMDQVSDLVTPVLAVVLRFFRSAFTNLAFVFERYQVAGVFLYPVGVGAVVRAAFSTVTCRERRYT